MAHALSEAGSVSWTMTTANLDAILHRYTAGEVPSIGSEAPRMGKWAFMPASSDRARSEHATLCHEGGEIELRYSSAVFEDFLKAMEVIHHDFDRRSQDLDASRMCADDQVRLRARV
ncbi:hypothetical protein [Streptomyces goshikiensis]|uniref:hypothetical protein n=1 Tax=Streptomyces goshikiensis TaxID=1942 RepID=UPI00370087AE